MKYNSLFESLSDKLGSRITTRRYNLSDMISESYRTIYDSKDNSNFKRLAESHLKDVKMNPTDIDRLSRNLSILKEISTLLESNEISDKDLKLATTSKHEGDIEKEQAEEREKRTAPTEDIEESSKCREEVAVEEKDIEESQHVDETELTEEELEELTKHLESIRKEKKKNASPEDKKDIDESKGRKLKRRVVETTYYQPTEEETDKIVRYILRKYGDSIPEEDYMDIVELVTGQSDVATDMIDAALEKARVHIVMPNYESKTYESLNLAEFSKKSNNKAFVKAFKKLEKKLQEGTALTRQESIDLYKAVNSAMTHLSVELERNPEFLSTFTESVNLLSADAAKVLDSLKAGKGPSKNTLKSLAKFSESILYESEDKMTPEMMTPEEMKEYWENNKDKDHILANYKSYEEWYKDSKANGYVKDDEDIDEAVEDEDEEEITMTDEESAEDVDEFDQEYADARVELHQELAQEFADDENPETQEKLAQDAAEVVDLPGTTEEQAAEILGDNSQEDQEEETPEDPEEDEEEITDEELAELKKHLTEMRQAKTIKENSSAESIRKAISGK